MIVVIGSPGAGATPRGVVAAGLPVAIARAAAAAGAGVQIVGRVGEDATADAVVLDLASAGVGHVAVLRTGGAETPSIQEVAPDDEGSPGAAAAGAVDAGVPAAPSEGLPLDAADLELALRYLPDYRVLVACPGLDEAATRTVVAAAGWSGARLIVVLETSSGAAELPAETTVLEQPTDGDDEAFAAVVARYAVELDRGSEPAAAFAAAATGAGWTNVND